MGEVIDVTKEFKRAERKAKWKQRFNNAKEWISDNKAVVIAVGPVLIGGVVKGIQVLGRAHNLRLERSNKDLRCYDASLGHYWELRRKLNNSEWVEIEHRRANGERLADILDDLNVLK